MKPGSLRNRTAIAGVAIVSVTLATVNVFVYLALRRQLEADLAALLSERVAITQHLAEELTAEELSLRLARMSLRATIETPDGAAVRIEPDLQQAAGRIVAPSSANPATVVSAPIDLPLGGVAIVEVARDGVDRALRRLLTLQVAATLVAVLVAWLLMSRASRRALAPLDDVIDLAGAIERGGTGQRLPGHTRTTELARLSAAFNRMLDALESAVSHARESDQRTRTFLDDAAHQLRTPVAGVKTAAEALLLMSDAPSSRGRREQLLQLISSGAAHAGALVHDLLVLARLDDGGSLDTAAVSLTDIISSEVERTAALAPGLDVSLTADNPITAVVDGHALRNAVANILDNARRYAVGMITVSAGLSGSHVRIVVHDDGPGPGGNHERLFDRFATQDPGGGAGLGLPIARAIARAHNGDVQYEDQAFILTVQADISIEPPVAPEGQRLGHRVNGPAGTAGVDLPD